MMFGCFRKGEANDPERYAAGITRILAEYPRQVIERVTDVFHGLPSKQDFLPTTREVKAACEAEMEPIRREQRRQAIQREQAKLLSGPEADRSSRKTYEELVSDLQRAGLDMASKKPAAQLSANMFCEKYGISRSQFDCIPDAEDRI